MNHYKFIIYLNIFNNTCKISKFLSAFDATIAICNFGRTLQSAKLSLFESMKSRSDCPPILVLRKASNLSKLFANRCCRAIIVKIGPLK